MRSAALTTDPSTAVFFHCTAAAGGVQTGQCLPSSYWCDGDNEYRDGGSAENTQLYGSYIYPADYWKCGDGSSVSSAVTGTMTALTAATRTRNCTATTPAPPDTGNVRTVCPQQPALLQTCWRLAVATCCDENELSLVPTATSNCWSGIELKRKSE